MLESEYQAYLIKRIEREILPGSLVIKNDPNYRQGIPDLSVFFGQKYGMLEVKASEKSREQPNQRWYLEHFGGAYSNFIYPENEEEVLFALEKALRG